MQKRSVFVVMCNDFPDSVFTTVKSAEAYCRLKREKRSVYKSSPIYWVVYEFRLKSWLDVDGGKSDD